MEDSVIDAMGKWPGVPALFGWLTLDQNGLWRLKGEAITHPNSRRFINHNYQADSLGRWFFQNGPQRVFVDLAYTPWVFHRSGPDGWATHTGELIRGISSVWLDEQGSLLFETERGIGLVKGSELVSLMEDFCDAQGRGFSTAALEQEIVRLESGSTSRLHLPCYGNPRPVRGINREAVPVRFGFQPRPRPEG